MITLNRRWKLPVPLFQLFIQLPFFRVETQLMYESAVNLVFNYIALYIQIWKMEFRFRIYCPDYRVHTEINTMRRLIDHYLYTVDTAHLDILKEPELFLENTKSFLVSLRKAANGEK